LLAFVAGLALPTTISNAVNFYVSTNGSDLNNGLTDTSSWRQISFAVTNSNISSGDVVNVAAGEYFETVIDMTIPITLKGTNLYIPSNPYLEKLIPLTIIKPQSTNDPLRPMQILIRTNGISIQSLTIDGDPDTNGTPDIAYGIYSTNRPLNVNHCIIRNINGFGISCWGLDPYPTTNDTDSVRSYFGYNTLTNITSTNPLLRATAIYMNMAPSTCEFNEIAGVNGTNANAGIYAYHCEYTSRTTNWTLLRSNYLERCTTAIWANDFAAPGEKIILTGNIINNGLIGIRVTAAAGQAIISSNVISVGGVSLSTNATPARGIWIHADKDPWSTSNATDHLVINNVITETSITTDKTAGLLFAYDTAIMTNMNNGVRATVLNNYISGFDYGAYVSSGSNDVSRPHDPLAQVVFHSNDFFNSTSYGLLATGVTAMVDASNNWWGYYFGPTGMYGTAVSTNVLYSWPLGAYRLDSNSNGTNDWLDPDDDGDGLSDTNEMALGINPAKADTDGDGLADPSEFIAGTDPTNSTSSFKFYGISRPSGTNEIELTWSSVTNRKYAIYRTTNMTAGFTLPLTSNITGIGSTTTYTDTTVSASVPYYFYRVSVTN